MVCMCMFSVPQKGSDTLGLSPLKSTHMRPSTACTQAHTSYLLLLPCMPWDLLSAPVPPQQTIQGDTRWKGLRSAVSTPPGSHRHIVQELTALFCIQNLGLVFHSLMCQGALRDKPWKGVSASFFYSSFLVIGSFSSQIHHCPQPIQPSPPPCLCVDGRGDSPGLPFLLHQSQPSFRDSSQFLQDVFVSRCRHRVPYTLVSFLDTIQI